ncbi:MAG: winged helix-turn-helix transcriptional regulator [Solirubrobacteraceae bacterium]
MAGSRRDRPPRDGEGPFAQLGHTAKRALLCALADGPLARAALAERLGVDERALSRLLNALARIGVLTRRPLASDRRQVECALTEAGRELLRIAEETVAVAPPAPSRPPTAPGVLELIADRRNRLIPRALLDRPQPFNELLRLVPELSPGALERHLERLTEGGLVRALPGEREGAPRYALTELAPRLRRVAVLGARWRWRWTPHSAPPMAGDLTGLIYLIAPLVRVRPGVDGVCGLHVRPPPEVAGWPDAHVSIAGGRVRLLALPPVKQPDARARATPLAWCEALLGGDLGEIEIDGDRAPIEALIAAFADALRI